MLFVVSIIAEVSIVTIISVCVDDWTPENVLCIIEVSFFYVFDGFVFKLFLFCSILDGEEADIEHPEPQ